MELQSRTINRAAPPLAQARVAWSPNPGTQELLVSCPYADVGFGGARGGGKSYGVIGDWLVHAAEYGRDAKGILFRQTYDELDELLDITRKIYPLTGATFKIQKRTWEWPTGASLKMRYLLREEDAEHYQGHSYTWLCYDDAGNVPAPKPIDLLRATLRSGAGVPPVFRITFNPGGVGHNWLKARYIDPAPPLTPFYDEEMHLWRVFIPSTLDDNVALTENDPDYWMRVEASASGDDALLKAWRWGLWDIVAGGMFDDVWKRDTHVVKPFAIPATWYVDRSFDWGSSKPFSVGWWAESDGTTAPNGRTYLRGTLFRTNEWYGSNGRPNEGVKMTDEEIADGIKERESKIPNRINAGPADSAIFDVDVNRSTSSADAMAARGVRFERADKSPGSRKQGWQKIRKMLKAARQWPMESPGLFIFDTCTDWIRTVPVLPRDKRDRDDVDTNAEDHTGDETRYRVLNNRSEGALI